MRKRLVSHQVLGALFANTWHSSRIFFLPLSLSAMDVSSISPALVGVIAIIIVLPKIFSGSDRVRSSCLLRKLCLIFI